MVRHSVSCCENDLIGWRSGVSARNVTSYELMTPEFRHPVFRWLAYIEVWVYLGVFLFQIISFTFMILNKLQQQPPLCFKLPPDFNFEALFGHSNCFQSILITLKTFLNQSNIIKYNIFVWLASFLLLNKLLKLIHWKKCFFFTFYPILNLRYFVSN